MRIKLVSTIMLCILMAAPAFAQNKQARSKAGDVIPAPTLLSEEGVDSASAQAENANKSKALREAAKNKREKAEQLKSKAANKHRSAVANFVQGLLAVADRQELGGIGDQVREFARLQNASEDKVIRDLENIKNRNKVRKFLFGADLKKTREIKKEMQAAEKRLSQLEKVKEGIDNFADKALIEEQIKNFQENINGVLKEVEAEEKVFSLFGWMKKIFT